MKKIAKIIRNHLYSDIKQDNVKCSLLDEEMNTQFDVNKSDTLFIITIDSVDYLVTVPMNKFWPLDQPLPEPIEATDLGPGWYEYLGGWYNF